MSAPEFQWNRKVCSHRCTFRRTLPHFQATMEREPLKMWTMTSWSTLQENLSPTITCQAAPNDLSKLILMLVAILVGLQVVFSRVAVTMSLASALSSCWRVRGVTGSGGTGDTWTKVHLMMTGKLWRFLLLKCSLGWSMFHCRLTCNRWPQPSCPALRVNCY